MKKFDWEYARENRNPVHTEWLWKNHKKPVTEDEFVAARTRHKAFAKGNGKWYQPSKSRRNYKNLKETFGFFP